MRVGLPQMLHGSVRAGRKNLKPPINITRHRHRCAHSPAEIRPLRPVPAVSPLLLQTPKRSVCAINPEHLDLSGSVILNPDARHYVSIQSKPHRPVAVCGVLPAMTQHTLAAHAE